MLISFSCCYVLLKIEYNQSTFIFEHFYLQMLWALSRQIIYKMSLSSLFQLRGRNKQLANICHHKKAEANICLSIFISQAIHSHTIYNTSSMGWQAQVMLTLPIFYFVVFVFHFTQIVSRSFYLVIFVLLLHSKRRTSFRSVLVLGSASCALYPPTKGINFTFFFLPVRMHAINLWSTRQHFQRPQWSQSCDSRI